MNIAKRLKLVRVSRDLTIQQVIKETGIHTYSRIETGQISPTLKKVEQLCDLFKIKLCDLLAEEFTITLD